MKVTISRSDNAREIWFDDPNKEFWSLVHKMQVDVFDMATLKTEEINITVKRTGIQHKLVMRFGGYGDVVLMDYNPNAFMKRYSFIYFVRKFITNSGLVFKTPKGDLAAYNDIVDYLTGEED